MTVGFERTLLRIAAASFAAMVVLAFVIGCTTETKPLPQAPHDALHPPAPIAASLELDERACIEAARQERETELLGASPRYWPTMTAWRDHLSECRYSAETAWMNQVQAQANALEEQEGLR